MWITKKQFERALGVVEQQLNLLKSIERDQHPIEILNNVGNDARHIKVDTNFGQIDTYGTGWLIKGGFLTILKGNQAVHVFVSFRRAWFVGDEREDGHGS